VLVAGLMVIAITGESIVSGVAGAFRGIFADISTPMSPRAPPG